MPRKNEEVSVTITQVVGANEVFVQLKNDEFQIFQNVELQHINLERIYDLGKKAI